MEDLHELVRARVPLRGALARAARERPRHARRPLPVRRVRRAAAADRLGSDRRRRPRADGSTTAGGHERGDDPRPRALRRAPGRRRRARRRARRGDGLRGARGPDVPARRVDLADRGHHARPRARVARAGRAGSRAVLEGGGRRPARRAGRAHRRDDERARGAGATKARSSALASEYGLDERAAKNLVTFLREQEAATGVVPSDRSIVVERFRDEIGDWRVCVLTPFGGARARAVGDGARGPPPRLARPARAVDLVGRRDRAALPGRGRAAAAGRPPARPGRGRGARPRRARRSRRSSARASARTPRARSSSRAAAPASGRRSGSSG